MSTSSPPDPDPRDTPDLLPGGGVPQGDTPPAASQEPAAAKDRHAVPNQGPKIGNRTPMIVTLVVVAIIVIAVIILGVWLATNSGETVQSLSATGIVAAL